MQGGVLHDNFGDEASWLHCSHVWHVLLHRAFASVATQSEVPLVCALYGDLHFIVQFYDLRTMSSA